jgi:hypothetical protein
MNTLGSPVVPPLFHKQAALGFVGYRPLDQGLRPLLSQSKRLMTVLTAAVSCDNAVVSDVQLTGKWKKNAQMSDDTNTLYDFVNLPWLLRKGERFFRYLELERGETEFRRTINAGGFLNVSETYCMKGELRKLKRRDLRSGMMDGKVERTPEGLKTTVSWTDPHGVSIEEIFCLSDDANELTVHTTAIRPVGGKTLKLKQVFSRM